MNRFFKILCRDLVENYRRAEKRLLLLDYDGTLVPFCNDPKSAIPGRDLLGILKTLSEDPRNEVVIISGRDRVQLQKWFGKLNFGLIAEHGAWIKKKETDWCMSEPISSSWKPVVMPIMKRYADRLPGTFVEEKEYSLVWHYRAADPDMALIKVGEIVDDLVNFTANIDVQVVRGDKIVEVRNAGINKGMALRYWIDESSFDFILAVGDDSTDEDMFRMLPDTAYTLKVGNSESCARFRLKDQSNVLGLVEKLAI
jgi:trehalose 6-phosphate synthase/phosphatase